MVKSLFAYVDGKRVCDVVRRAWDEEIVLDVIKKQIIEENKGKVVEFKFEERDK